MDITRKVATTIEITNELIQLRNKIALFQELWSQLPSDRPTSLSGDAVMGLERIAYDLLEAVQSCLERLNG